MAIKKNSYYVLYVKGCSPKVKTFKTKASMNIFLKQFIDKYGSIDDGEDNWIDHVFRGEKLNLLQLVSVKVKS